MDGVPLQLLKFILAGTFRKYCTGIFGVYDFLVLRRPITITIMVVLSVSTNLLDEVCR